MRHDGRTAQQLRPVTMTPNFIIHPEGSVLIEVGNTKVICNATIETRVPHFIRGTGKGWITAEYSMLPRATTERTSRESSRGKVTGRTMEIQRLIGRALRAVTNLEALGEKTVWVDCDVIQADGGTRTASITGAFVALALALDKLDQQERFETFPLTQYLAATSVGKVGENLVLDLDFVEDSSADVDMNVIMTSNGEFVELQGTGEEATFTKREMFDLIELAEGGIQQLINLQRDVLGEVAQSIGRQDETNE